MAFEHAEVSKHEYFSSREKNEKAETNAWEDEMASMSQWASSAYPAFRHPEIHQKYEDIQKLQAEKKQKRDIKEFFEDSEAIGKFNHRCNHINMFFMAKCR